MAYLTANDLKQGAHYSEGDELSWDAVQYLNCYLPLVVGKSNSDGSLHFFKGQVPYSFNGKVVPVPKAKADGWGRLIDRNVTLKELTDYKLTPAHVRTEGRASFTSKATGDWKTEGQTTWNEAGHPVAGDSVSIGAHTISLSQAEACASITFSGAGTLALSSYAITMTSTFTLNATGTLTASTGGLTGCTSATFDNVVTCTGAAAFSVAGNVTISGTYTYSTSVITTTAAGTFDADNTDVEIYSWTHNASGLTQTLGDDINVLGLLTVTAGTVAASTFDLNVTGATSVTGSITYGDTASADGGTFTGDVTINANGAIGTTTAQWKQIFNVLTMSANPATFNMGVTNCAIQIKGNHTGSANVVWGAGASFGTLIYNGTTQTISGFSNASSNYIGASTITFSTSTTLTITGSNYFGKSSSIECQLIFNMSGSLADGGTGTLGFYSTKTTPIVLTSGGTNFSTINFVLRICGVQATIPEDWNISAAGSFKIQGNDTAAKVLINGDLTVATSGNSNISPSSGSNNFEIGNTSTGSIIFTTGTSNYVNIGNAGSSGSTARTTITNITTFNISSNLTFGSSHFLSPNTIITNNALTISGPSTFGANALVYSISCKSFSTQSVASNIFYAPAPTGTFDVGANGASGESFTIGPLSTFYHNSGTITLKGGGYFSVDSNPTFINNLTCSAVGDRQMEASYSTTINGNFVLSGGGRFYPNGNTITVTGTTTISSTSIFAIYCGATTSSGMIFNGAVSQSAGTVSTVALAGSQFITINAGYTNNGGSFSTGGGTITIAAGQTFANNSGAFNFGNGTLQGTDFTSIITGTVSPTSSSTGTLKNIYINGALTTSSTANISLGGATKVTTLTIATGTTITGAGFTMTAGTVNIDGAISGVLNMSLYGTGTLDILASSGNVNNLEITDGTQTCDSGISWTVGGTTTVSGGILTFAGTQTWTNTGTFTVSGGTVTPIATTTFNLDSTLTISSGTFGAAVEYTLDIDASNAASAGTLIAPTGTGFTFSGATWYTPTTFTAGTGTVTFDLAGTTTLGNASLQFASVIISGGATLNTSAASNFNLTASATMVVGVSGGATTGVFVGNDSDISIGTGRVTGYALTVYEGSTFTGGTGDHIIGGLDTTATTTLTLTSGTTTINGYSNAGSLNNAFTIKDGCTFDDGDGTLSFTNTAAAQRMAIYTNFIMYNLTVAKTAQTLEFSATSGTGKKLTVANNMTLTSGTFSPFRAGGSEDWDLTVSNEMVINGTLAAYNASGAPAISFGTVSIGAAGVYDTTTGTTTMTGLASGGDDTIWSKHATGTVTNHSNKVTFTAASTHEILGDNVWYDLEILPGSACTYEFETGKTQQVTHSVNMTGFGAAALLILTSTTAADHWNYSLDSGVTQNHQYLDVHWSDASVGADDAVPDMATKPCTDGGDNVDWIFNLTNPRWLGTTSTSWSVAANWEDSLVPAADEDVIFDGSYSNANCTIDAATNVLNSINTKSNYTGTITINDVLSTKKIASYYVTDPACDTTLDLDNAIAGSSYLKITDTTNLGCNQAICAVTVDGAGKTVTQTSATLTITNAMTITNGTYTIACASAPASLVFAAASPTLSNSGVLNATGNGTNAATISASGANNLAISGTMPDLNDVAGGDWQFSKVTFGAALTTGGNSVVVTQTGAVTCSSTLTVASGDTWAAAGQTLTYSSTISISGTISATANGQIIGTASQSVNIQSGGRAYFVGTAGNEVDITSARSLTFNDGSTCDIDYVTCTNNNTTYGALIYGSSGASTITNTKSDHITATNNNAAGKGISFQTTNEIVITNSTFSGGDDSAFGKTDVYIYTNCKASCGECTFSTISMEGATGWLTKVNSTNYIIYGIIASSETPSTGYKGSECNGNLTISQANFYSSSFNTSYTLGANAANVDAVSVAASTTLAVSTLALTCSSTVSVAGSLTVAAAGSLTHAGKMTISGGIVGTNDVAWNYNQNAEIEMTTGTFYAPSDADWVCKGDVDFQGGTFDNGGAGTCAITAASVNISNAATGNFYNISTATSGTTTQGSAITAAGTLTVGSGTVWNSYDGATSHALTSTGACADNGTMYVKASTVSLGAGVTTGYGLAIGVNSVFCGAAAAYESPSGTHTFGPLGSGASTCRLCMSTGTTTINSAWAGVEMNIETTLFSHGIGGTLVINATPAQIYAPTNGQTLSLQNFTINASKVVTLSTGNSHNFSIAGTFTCNGSFDTNATNNRNLTVTGATSVSGTLTCNSSVVSLGSGWDTNTHSLSIANGGAVTSSGTITSGTLEAVSGASFISSGTLIINGRNTNKGYNAGLVLDFITSGTFTVVNLEMNFAGTSNISINNLSPQALGALIIRAGTTCSIGVGSTASYLATMTTLTVENSSVFMTYWALIGNTHISVSGATSVVGTLTNYGSTCTFTGGITNAGTWNVSTATSTTGNIVNTGTMTYGFNTKLVAKTGGATYNTYSTGKEAFDDCHISGYIIQSELKLPRTKHVKIILANCVCLQPLDPEIEAWHCVLKQGRSRRMAKVKRRLV